MQQIDVHPERWQAGRGYRKQPLATAGALAAPGTLVQLVEMAPGDTIPDHVHSSAREFYCVLSGGCLLAVNGNTLRLEPGDMLLTEPGDVHRLHNDGAEPFRLLVFKTNAAPGDTHWIDDVESEL
jgi:quercetin dioxygenase-like cupin family protein